MAKTIIFCADGTWDGPEERTGTSPIDGNDEQGELGPGAPVTNIVKLFSRLAGDVTHETMALRNEQEKVWNDPAGAGGQVSKYLHGVGDSKNVILKLLGGALGTGVVARLVRGYTFISRNYDLGDDIHIAGFSRGAYTARALAGMITTVGLLNRASYDPDDKAEAYRLAIGAWCKSRGAALGGAGRLTDLAQHLLGVVEHFFADRLPPGALLSNIPIKSVAVWDTVGALGIPLYAADGRYDAFRFADTALSKQVENGFHAISIDELRGDFGVTRWDDRAGISEVWFVGAHADIGGGYPQAESGLSNIALYWMSRKLAAAGVRLRPPLPGEPPAQGFAQAIHTPWSKHPFDLLPRVPRRVNPSDVVHETVVDRFQSDKAYRPAALEQVAAGLFSGMRRET
jgi:Uncharacterized alpha/beta hydrolase domain (DUF2235)